MMKETTLKIAAFYFAAFAMSAIVTYMLPGHPGKDGFAFVDMVGILLSLVFLVFGVIYAGFAAKDELRK